MIDFVAYCVFMGFALFIARSALVKVKHYKHDAKPDLFGGGHAWIIVCAVKKH